MRPFYLSILLLTLFSISPHESDQSRLSYFPFQPDPWEIEEIGKQKFKPYDDKHKHNATGLLGSVENNQPCFGNGTGDYRVVNFTDIKLQKLSYEIGQGFNEVVDEYLSKYCKNQKCRVDENQNKFVCKNDGIGFDKAADKSIALVLLHINKYLLYQTEKFKLSGKKKKPIKDGEPCVQPPYKLPFDKQPTKSEQNEFNEYASKSHLLGQFCESKRCYYDYPSKIFLCCSSSIQAMGALIATLLILLLNHQY